MVSVQILRRSLCAALATAVSVVCAAMAAAAAVERAATSDDRTLVTAVAVALVLGAHMLPALARRHRLAQALFMGCVAATLYHHAHYFAGVQERVGAQRAAVVTPSGHAQALQAELQAHVATRALPVVAADLAQASAKLAQAQAGLARCTAQSGERCHSAQASVLAADARVQALQDERSSAQRATALRIQLADAAAGQDRQRAAQATDPVDARLASITGLEVGTVALASALVQSLLLELMAALLWTLALPVPTAAQPVAVATPAVAAAVPPISQPVTLPPVPPTALPAHAGGLPLLQRERIQRLAVRWRCWPSQWHDSLTSFIPPALIQKLFRKIRHDFQHHSRATTQPPCHAGATPS
ncbi:MAG: hypothetical protein K2Y10_00380 [Burkholderiaceae bacterium]|nr:hypothetical protein [Burkholderiaceae bacterium]MBY0454741.1 hypothetical protein [Burkholderiaceae bacterium]